MAILEGRFHRVISLVVLLKPDEINEEHISKYLKESFDECVSLTDTNALAVDLVKTIKDAVNYRTPLSMKTNEYFIDVNVASALSALMNVENSSEKLERIEIYIKYDFKKLQSKI